MEKAVKSKDVKSTFAAQAGLAQPSMTLRKIERMREAIGELQFSLIPYRFGIYSVPVSYLDGKLLKDIIYLVRDLKQICPTWEKETPLESIRYMLAAKKVAESAPTLIRDYSRKGRTVRQQSGINIWGDKGLHDDFEFAISKLPVDEATGADAWNEAGQICSSTVEQLKKAVARVDQFVLMGLRKLTEEAERIKGSCTINQATLTAALRSFAHQNLKSTEKKLKKEASAFKESHRDKIDEGIWEKLLDQEHEILKTALDGKIEVLDERFEHSPFFSESPVTPLVKEQEKDKKKLVSMIQAFVDTSMDDELFNLDDYALVETELLIYLDSKNFRFFCELVLRHNIIMCGVFPDLSPEFKEWMKGEEDEKEEEVVLSHKRQTIYDAVMKYIGKGDWKAPVTAESVKQFMHVVLGREPQTLDVADRQMPEKLWSLFEDGRTGENTRIEIAWANIVGFLSACNLLSGGSTVNNRKFFGEQKDLVSNINRGEKMEVKALAELKLFLEKYCDRIIKGI